MATLIAESPTRPRSRLLPAVLLGPLSPAGWLATVHVLVGLPVAVAGVLVVVAVVVSSVLLAVGVGIPLLAGALLLTRRAARWERARVHAFCGVDLVPPAGPQRRAGSRTARMLRSLRNPAPWRAAGYFQLLPFVAAIGAAVVLACWAGGLCLAALPAYAHLLPPEPDRLLDVPTSGRRLALATAIGVLLLFLAPWAARAAAAAQVSLARALLGGTSRAALAERVETLQSTRARVVDAADGERRRIERDLHDGAQQRLVSLAMNLGRARTKFETDPDAARTLVGAAHDDAKAALTELRNLARGIHPAVLTDRGLDAALSAVAARSPVPVEVRVREMERPDRTAEAVAYFLVAEALTNVARHAHATRAEVAVERNGDRLLVTVRDDGVGGVRPDAGTGLRGLADRLAAVDGTLAVDSPVGGPTVLRAELPCGS